MRRSLRVLGRVILFGGALTGLLAAAGRMPAPERALGVIPLARLPYLPGSRIALRVEGFPPPYTLDVLGPVALRANRLRIPSDSRDGAATVIAGNAFGTALAMLQVAPPPRAATPTVAVACYADGVALYDAARFTPLGLIGIDGAPSDVAAIGNGRLVATQTQGPAVTVVRRHPWSVTTIPGVPFGDEVAVDPRTGAAFVTNRDVDGRGALTRIERDGSTTRIPLGETPEGLAIDARRNRAYVADVNAGTIDVVDTHRMREIRRFHAVARVFSLALSSHGAILYAVSNQSASSPFGAPGRVVAIALRPHPHRIAASAPLTFPLGIALEQSRNRVFVTDESADVVDVLDARTLRAVHAPLRTCATPWKPLYDPRSARLYVPCARADAVDVFDTRTLRRVAGAPFSTAGYPLAVALWHRA